MLLTVYCLTCLCLKFRPVHLDKALPVYDTYFVCCWWWWRLRRALPGIRYTRTVPVSEKNKWCSRIAWEVPSTTDGDAIWLYEEIHGIICSSMFYICYVVATMVTNVN